MYLVDHGALVEHVWVEEPVPEPDVVGHFLPVGCHSGQHGSDQRVAESKGRRGEFVKDARIASDVIVVGITLRLNAQVVQVHVVPADDARQKLVERHVLVDG